MGVPVTVVKKMGVLYEQLFVRVFTQDLRIYLYFLVDSQRPKCVRRCGPHSTHSILILSASCHVFSTMLALR